MGLMALRTCSGAPHVHSPPPEREAQLAHPCALSTREPFPLGTAPEVQSWGHQGRYCRPSPKEIASPKVGVMASKQAATSTGSQPVGVSCTHTTGTCGDPQGRPALLWEAPPPAAAASSSGSGQCSVGTPLASLLLAGIGAELPRRLMGWWAPAPAPPHRQASSSCPLPPGKAQQPKRPLEVGKNPFFFEA